MIVFIVAVVAFDLFLSSAAGGNCFSDAWWSERLICRDCCGLDIRLRSYDPCAGTDGELTYMTASRTDMLLEHLMGAFSVNPKAGLPVFCLFSTIDQSFYLYSNLKQGPGVCLVVTDTPECIISIKTIWKGWMMQLLSLFGVIGV